MKSALGAMFILIGSAAFSPAQAAVCPAIGASADCSVLITRNPNGGFTAASTGIGPYDGSEDTLVGIVNNGADFLTSIALSSSTDIFGFDGDGIDAFSGGGSYGPTGYEGPGTSFSVVDAFHGTVNFLGGGLAPGKSAYFALEENLAGTVGSPVPITVGTVPEIGTWLMMILGFGFIGAITRSATSEEQVLRKPQFSTPSISRG